MTEVTLRDAVWFETMPVICTKGRFTTSDIETDASARTVRSVLSSQESHDWLYREHSNSTEWSAGVKSVKFLNMTEGALKAVSDDVLKEAGVYSEVYPDSDSDESSTETVENGC